MICSLSVVSSVPAPAVGAQTIVVTTDSNFSTIPFEQTNKQQRITPTLLCSIQVQPSYLGRHHREA